jgi:hypothetical protein
MKTTGSQHLLQQIDAFCRLYKRNFTNIHLGINL